MLKINTYTAKGGKLTPTTLPKEMEAVVNLSLLAQVMRVYEDRQHKSGGRAKTRSEVNATTKKIWKQKGTGRARHGAKSAPIFVGGGKAHGPRGINRVLNINQNMKNKALQMVISKKVKEGNVVAVKGLETLKKTKETQLLINNIARSEKVEGNVKYSFFISDKNKDSVRFVRNLSNVNVYPFSSMNAHQVYFGGLVVIDTDAIEKKVTKSEK